MPSFATETAKIENGKLWIAWYKEDGKLVHSPVDDPKITALVRIIEGMQQRITELERQVSERSP